MMAVEKMEMLNLVAPIEELHDIAREVVLLENVHLVNAMNEINESNFTLCIMEENIDELVEMCIIKSFKTNENYTEINNKMRDILRYFNIEPKISKQYLKEPYDLQDIINNIEEIYPKINDLQEKKESLLYEKKYLEDFDGHISHLKNSNINLKELENLNFFNYKIGVLSKENRIKLKKNYENISAIVLHIGSNKSGEVYLIISPKELETETNRILRSLNFREIKVPKEYIGQPHEIVDNVEGRIKRITHTLERLDNQLEEYKEIHREEFLKYYSILKLEEEIAKLKNETATTNSFFYLSGWVPIRDKERIKDTFKKYGDKVLVMFKSAQEVHKYITPPTKLRNNRLTKPFEALVKMYGVPSYTEMDPTLFLGITYLILFGAMFGDVGQGAVLLLLGLYISKYKNNEIFGGILSRLGFSSTIFGFLYGSVFGFEDIIHPLLVSPLESINEMLIGSVAIGVILLFMSFIYSIANNLKQKDLQEGVFGRNGINGLIFYIVILLLVVGKLMDKSFIPTNFAYGVIVFSITLLILREPLTNLILGKRPLYHEAVSAYYIESGFDLFETILNFMSNTISFIRVGAFALNHVGLFIAFHTMAEILNNLAGSIIIFILGNIIVIGLEGLIVFIQGLRLEYYELFSKYYRGEGIEYKPVNLKVN